MKAYRALDIRDVWFVPPKTCTKHSTFLGSVGSESGRFFKEEKNTYLREDEGKSQLGISLVIRLVGNFSLAFKKVKVGRGFGWLELYNSKFSKLLAPH